jgi:hypothetical protein
MAAFFSYLNYKDSNYGQNDGYISNIQASGVSPLTVTITGPFGYSAGPFTLPPDLSIPDQTGLRPGIYTLTVVDDDASETSLEITIAELPEVILSASIGDSCACGNCECVVDITSFIHNSNCFTYNLYKDGVLFDTFSGCSGQELFQFTGLCTADYTVEAIETDGILYTYTNGGGCSSGTVKFNESDDPTTIVNNWSRWMFLANSTLTTPAVANLSTGLNPTTGVISNAAGTYFERGVAWDLGDFNLPMGEGENIGPAVASAGNYRRYYYNTAINKYVVCLEVAGGLPATTYWWCVFDPRENTGLATGNPTSSRYLTTDTQWDVVALPGTLYTINAANIVVSAVSKVTSPFMIECINNSAFFNGFYSVCGFNDFIHEVTLGSTDSDNDDIGIVIAAFKDITGLYGPINQTHTLSLVFNNQNFNTAIVYNIGQNSYSFTDGVSYSGTVALLNSTPFISGAYSNRGTVRVKIEKQGKDITISTTNRMGTQGGAVQPGQLNPYNAPLFVIDLLDKTTWLDAPAYAVGDELAKFVGPVQIGYLTGSQPTTQFFDIAFDGEQVTTTSEPITENSAEVNTNFPTCPCYRATNCDDRSEQLIFNTRPQTNIDVSLTYSFVEHPDKCWTVEITTDCKDQVVLTVDETFATCNECMGRCYELIDCQGLLANILTHSNLILYVDQVIKITGCPDTCWTVTTLPECPLNTVPVSLIANYEDCESCLPVVPVIPLPPLNIRNRTVKPGYDTPGCSPEYVDKISCKFAEAMFQHAASRRYGITFCCNQDLTKWAIKMELLELRMIYDPTACLAVEASPCCAPCNVTASLITFNPAGCPAPSNISVQIESNTPPPVPNCFSGYAINPNEKSPVTINAFLCDGTPIEIVLGPSQQSQTYCINLDQPITATGRINTVALGICS